MNIFKTYFGRAACTREPMSGIERLEFPKNYRKSALNNSFAMDSGFSKSSLFIKREDLPAYLNLFNPMNIVQKATNRLLPLLTQQICNGIGGTQVTFFYSCELFYFC